MNVSALIITASVFVFLLIIMVVVVVMLLKKKSKDDYYAVIDEKDAHGQLRRTYDRGRIYVDKQTNNQNIYLKKIGIGLKPDKIPYVSDATGKRWIRLYRVGLKNFRFVDESIKEVEGKLITSQVGEEDVNWALNAYERSKKLIGKSTLEKVLPYVMGFIVIAVVGVVAIMLIRKFDTLPQTAQIMKEIAEVQMNTVQTLSQIHNMTQGTGSTVIVG